MKVELGTRRVRRDGRARRRFGRSAHHRAGLDPRLDDRRRLAARLGRHRHRGRDDRRRDPRRSARTPEDDRAEGRREEHAARDQRPERRARQRQPHHRRRCDLTAKLRRPRLRAVERGAPVDAAADARRISSRAGVASTVAALGSMTTPPLDGGRAATRTGASTPSAAARSRTKPDARPRAGRAGRPRSLPLEPVVEGRGQGDTAPGRARRRRFLHAIEELDQERIDVSRPRRRPRPSTRRRRASCTRCARARRGRKPGRCPCRP